MQLPRNITATLLSIDDESLVLRVGTLEVRVPRDEVWNEDEELVIGEEAQLSVERAWVDASVPRVAVKALVEADPERGVRVRIEGLERTPPLHLIRGLPHFGALRPGTSHKVEIDGLWAAEHRIRT